MNYLVLLFLVFILPVATANQNLISVDIQTTNSGLISHGKQEVALVMTPKPGWHGYWKQPGDVGFPTKMEWTLPDGVSIGETHYPVPTTLLIDDMMNHVFEGEYTLLTDVTIDSSLQEGEDIPISVKLDYLVCNDQTCIPESSTVKKVFTITDSLILDDSLQFSEYKKALPKPLSSKGSYFIDDEKLIFDLSFPSNVELDNPHLFVAESDVAVNASVQQFIREGDVLRIITQAASPDLRKDVQAVLSFGDGMAVSFIAQPSVQYKDGLLWTFIFTFFSAILGGILLNLMPCVLPVLSMKVIQVINTESSKERRSEAVWYAVGVLLCCSVLGLVILLAREMGVQMGWAFQLQSPHMIFVLLLLTTAIAFNLAGLFEIKSITQNGYHNTNRRGAVIAGVMVALVATPCSGPFMATALGAALILPPIVGLFVFTGLGLGIALPFLLLAFVPAFAKFIPKPGYWMTDFKRFLSIPMFTTVLALLWILSRQSSAESLVFSISAIFVFSLGLWFFGLRQIQHKPRAWLPLLIFFLLAVLIYYQTFEKNDVRSFQKTNAEPYSEVKLKEYMTSGSPIFLYFTADWCITCKLNEVTVINTQETKKLFDDAGVKVMVGDWTNGDSNITHILERHKRSGVPLYLWFNASDTTPYVLPQVLTQTLISTLLSSD